MRPYGLPPRHRCDWWGRGDVDNGWIDKGSERARVREELRDVDLYELGGFANECDAGTCDYCLGILDPETTRDH